MLPTLAATSCVSIESMTLLKTFEIICETICAVSNTGEGMGPSLRPSVATELVDNWARASFNSAPPSAKPLRAARSLHAAIDGVQVASEAAEAWPPESRAPVRLVDREAAGSRLTVLGWGSSSLQERSIVPERYVVGMAEKFAALRLRPLNVLPSANCTGIIVIRLIKGTIHLKHFPRTTAHARPRADVGPATYIFATISAV